MLSEDTPNEIGMIGLNPHTGRPLNLGVTVSVSKENVQPQPGLGTSINVQGSRRFEVQGEPWLDESESFYLADVEIVEDREEKMSLDKERESREMSSTIPGLVEEWLKLVVTSGKSDEEGMERRMKVRHFLELCRD